MDTQPHRPALGLAFALGLATASMAGGGCIVDNPGHCQNAGTTFLERDSFCESDEYCVVGTQTEYADGCAKGDPAGSTLWVGHCIRQQEPDEFCQNFQAPEDTDGEKPESDPTRYCTTRTTPFEMGGVLYEVLPNGCVDGPPSVSDPVVPDPTDADPCRWECSHESAAGVAGGSVSCLCGCRQDESIVMIECPGSSLDDTCARLYGFADAVCPDV